MKGRCVIITALLDCELSSVYSMRSDDYIICADGGISISERAGITPHLVMGDLDSVFSVSEEYTFIKHPKEKDDTDTMLCLKYGIEKGFKDFLIIGGIGGRFDHTLANLQTLAFAKENDAKASIVSKDTFCTIIKGGEEYVLAKKDGAYFSVFSYSEKCEKVSIKGAKYELDGAELKNSFPLGVSNEFRDESARISVGSGMLIIVVSSS